MFLYLQAGIWDAVSCILLLQSRQDQKCQGICKFMNLHVWILSFAMTTHTSVYPNLNGNKHMVISIKAFG